MNIIAFNILAVGSSYNGTCEAKFIAMQLCESGTVNLIRIVRHREMDRHATWEGSLTELWDHLNKITPITDDESLIIRLHMQDVTEMTYMHGADGRSQRTLEASPTSACFELTNQFYQMLMHNMRLIMGPESNGVAV